MARTKQKLTASAPIEAVSTKSTAARPPVARLYLRASTDDQDADRARDALVRFAKEHDIRIVGTYIENEGGTRLARPELFRMIRDSDQEGDIILVEQIDRLSRLNEADWKKLRAEIESRGLRVVSMDMPTSWQLANASPDEFTSRMMSALNSLMMDALAAMAAKDYADRRRRQAEGIAKHRAAGGYIGVGRPEDTDKAKAIAKLLGAGLTWSEVMASTNASRGTVAKVASRLKAAAAPKAATAPAKHQRQRAVA